MRTATAAITPLKRITVAVSRKGTIRLPTKPGSEPTNMNALAGQSASQLPHGNRGRDDRGSDFSIDNRIAPLASGEREGHSRSTGPHTGNRKCPEDFEARQTPARPDFQPVDHAGELESPQPC